MDGVLIDLKEVHRDAFLEAVYAVEKTWIEPEWHDKNLCGLPTTAKLEKMNVHPRSREAICKIKQEKTLEKINTIEVDYELYDILYSLTKNQYCIFCCSNSLVKTVEIVLRNLGVIDLFTDYLGNDDVFSPKPSPEIFYKVLAIYMRP
jgi:beta-phosphoglucomutase-like phosphatase (HAD superfamily)